MFRTLIYPSSGACDCVDELPHLSSCSQFVVCWSFGAAGFEWCCGCVVVLGGLVLSSLCVGAFGAAGFRWCSFCR